MAPHLIPEEQPLASVDDVFNAVVVRGNATGEVMFYGQGAGELPTASACVADVMEALQSSPRREEIGWEADPAGFEDPQALRSRYYFRIGGSLSAAAAAFGQVEILSEDGGETAFLTGLHQRSRGREAGRRPARPGLSASAGISPKPPEDVYTGTGGNRDLRLDSDLKKEMP